MTRRRRTALYVLLALAVPLPAFAISGEEGAPSPGLSVTASLDHCGILNSGVVCKIDAGWNAVPGAERYTASLTSPDGSVVDYGEVGAGGSSFWVPYVGSGTYTVSVSAWGTPPGEDDPEVIEVDASEGANRGAAQIETEGGGLVDPPDEPGTDPSGEPGEGEEPTEEPPVEEPPVEEPPVDEPPCDPEPIEPPEPAPAPGDPGAGGPESAPGDATGHLPEITAETLDDGELPDTVECPPPASAG